MKTIGVREKSTRSLHIEEIYRNGFTIIPNCISISEVAELKSTALKFIDSLSKDEVKNAEVIGDHGIVRALFCNHAVYRDIILNTTVKHYLDFFLDREYHLYSQVVATSNPDAQLNQIGWHREIFYQHFTSSRPLALQTIFVLDPFNESTGGTLFLSGSHLFEDFPCEEYVEKFCVQPTLNPGDCIVMNSMTYHRAGINTSLRNRMLITNTFVRPFISTQFDYTRMMEKPKDDRFAQLAGFRWNNKMTLSEWQISKKANL